MSTESDRLTEVEVLQLQIASQSIALCEAQLTAAEAQAEAARMMAQAHAADAAILRARVAQAKAEGIARGQAIRAAHGLGPKDTISEDGSIIRTVIPPDPPSPAAAALRVLDGGIDSAAQARVGDLAHDIGGTKRADRDAD